MDPALQPNKLPKDLLQWSMGNKMHNMASHWEKPVVSFQNICLREIPFKELVEITRGWNPNRQFKLLEEREANIWENQTIIQDIEEHSLTPSGSQRIVNQPSSLVASHHSGNSRSVAKGHHYSQSKIVSRRRRGQRGKNKTPFNQRHK
ncbi:hypothetical protein O181_133323 [Austropuccinia psidii MF-1]|uniref:Uncharacterized protein n=1 Tax=Austropuccinia psidii MF-1 TaxID=1389203 RepID=A0A9Q3L433_9BASI|nr:hypothetical protein [Austropuccinia psidii MF-1]